MRTYIHTYILTYLLTYLHTFLPCHTIPRRTMRHDTTNMHACIHTYMWMSCLCLLVLIDGSYYMPCTQARIKYTEAAFLFKVLVRWNCRPMSEVDICFLVSLANANVMFAACTCQVAQGRDWERRFYPADASTNARVLGPSCPPHGMNWRIPIPSCHLAIWCLACKMEMFVKC